MLENLLAKIDPNHQADRNLITRAFEFAKKAHGKQLREDGESYITHPLAAAKIIADLKLDSATIAACLMHDVLEDTEITEKEMEKEFGKEITFLVKGVTKLAGLTYQGGPDIKAKQNLKAQSLRKMFFAMAEDIRVILIKLADRYHNMSTLWTCSPEKRKRISLETLEIYAPIAERLGMGQIKGDLEDMAFAHAYPEEYKLLLGKIKDKYADRQNYLEKVKPIVMKSLSENKIKVLDAHAS